MYRQCGGCRVQYVQLRDWALWMAVGEMAMEMDANALGCEDVGEREAASVSGAVRAGLAWLRLPKEGLVLFSLTPLLFFCERETRGRRADAMRAKEEERDG